jgi:hypothetical protein
MKGEDQMTCEELFDAFVGGQTGVDEIAAMDLETVARQIGELRANERDDIGMSDREIAEAILKYARSGSE